MNDFFIPENKVDIISEEDYKQANFIIDSLNAFARLTYQSFYVLDLFNKNFFYVSDNPLFLCGHQPDEIKEMGYRCYMDLVVPKDELKLLLEMNREGFVFFNKIPVDERLKISSSLDFHIINGNRKRLINHKLSPTLLARNGNIWLATCIVSFSHNQKAGNFEIYMEGKPYVWIYSVESHSLEKQDAISLSKRESDILILSAQGFTASEIADKLCITESTVNYHKQHLFEKLDVNNMTTALYKASQNKMI